MGTNKNGSGSQQYKQGPRYDCMTVILQQRGNSRGSVLFPSFCAFSIVQQEERKQLRLGQCFVSTGIMLYNMQDIVLAQRSLADAAYNSRKCFYSTASWFPKSGRLSFLHRWLRCQVTPQSADLCPAGSWNIQHYSRTLCAMAVSLFCLETTGLRSLEWHTKAGESQGAEFALHWFPVLKLITTQREVCKQKCTVFIVRILHKGLTYTIKGPRTLCRVNHNSWSPAQLHTLFFWMVSFLQDCNPTSYCQHFGKLPTKRAPKHQSQHLLLLVGSRVLRALFRNDKCSEKRSWPGNENPSCKIFAVLKLGQLVMMVF